MLTQLPVVVVDSLLGKYFPDNDLRAIHQVSKGWKNLIESRPLVNARRLALVKKVKEHKENIRKSTQPLVLPAEAIGESKANEELKTNKENHEKTTGSGRVLRNLGNRLLETPVATSSVEPSPASSGRRRNTQISSTPKSRFQRRYEAGLKLMPGQVLFSCPGCNSPVPSPVPATSQEEKPTADSDAFESHDSGISMTSGFDEDFSQLMHRADAGNASNNFNFHTPDIESSINISMIATPPCTPSNPDTGINEYGSITSEEPLRDLLETKSPSCLFIASASTISISEYSLPLDVNGNCSLQETEESHVQSVHLSETTEPEMNQSQDSGIAECPEEELNLESTDSSQSAELHSLSVDTKKLRLKSCSSPSLLVSEVKTEMPVVPNIVNTSPAVPVVIQCPDCSLRFCSYCKFSEHKGKPCRVLGGDEMYEDNEDFSCHIFFPIPTARPPLSKPRARSATSSTSTKLNKKKGSLRRLAYL